jgi:hypothetical protein
VLFPQLLGKCQGKTRKDGARAALYHISLYLCCSDVIICVVRLLFVLFYVVLVCKCVQPPGDNPTAVNKYIIIYIIIKTSELSPRALTGADCTLHTARSFTNKSINIQQLSLRVRSIRRNLKFYLYLKINVLPLKIFHNIKRICGNLSAPRPTPKLENRLISAVRDCLIKHICSYPPYLEAVPPSAN